MGVAQWVKNVARNTDGLTLCKTVQKGGRYEVPKTDCYNLVTII